MQKHGILDYGKAQTGASHLARTALVHTIEALEEARQVLGRHTNAIVGKGECPLGRTVVVAYGRLNHACIGTLSRKSYGGTFARIGNGVVGEIAEHAVEQTLIAPYHDVVGQKIVECHVLLLQLQGSLLLYVLHHLRYVYIIGARHLGRVVHAVERRYVVQERREALALGVASAQELLAHLVVDVGIVEYCLQIALYARHGGLEFVGYVLRQLAFEYILFAPCRLQALVYLDDAFGYFAQLIGRKLNEVFCIERLTVVGSRCKSAQFLDRKSVV